MSHLGPTSKKRTFTLKNVDLISTNLKYGLVVLSNFDKNKEKDTPAKTTKISDVIMSDTDYPISFLDENKKQYNTKITMVEFTKHRRLPVQTNVKCFWCRHSFDTRPLGCPVKYIHSVMEKSYVSHITKDKYNMKENTTTRKMDKIMANVDIQQHIEITPLENNYYLTDGIFCSFNCALSFIKDKNNDLFYKESYSLLHTLYYDFVGKKAEKLLPAPDWRLLEEYGGSMSIKEFRESFYKIQYEFMFTIRSVNANDDRNHDKNDKNDKNDKKEMHPISKVFREKLLL